MQFRVYFLSLALHTPLAAAVVIPSNHAVAHESIQRRLVHHAHSFVKAVATDEVLRVATSFASQAHEINDVGKTSGHRLVGLISTLTEEFRGLDFGSMFWSNADGIVSLELSCVPSFPDSGGKDTLVTIPLGQWEREGILPHLLSGLRITDSSTSPRPFACVCCTYYLSIESWWTGTL